MDGVVPKITSEHDSGIVSPLIEEIRRQQLIWVRCIHSAWVGQRIIKSQASGSCLQPILATSKLKRTLETCMKMVWAFGEITQRRTCGSPSLQRHKVIPRRLSTATRLLAS